MGLLTASRARRRTSRLFVACLVVLASMATLTVGPVEAASRTATTPAGLARVSQVGPTMKPAVIPWLPAQCQNASASRICRITHFAKRPWLLLWGDSHALQYLTSLRRAAHEREFNLVIIFSGACPLSLPFPASTGEPRLTCDEHNVRAINYVRDLADSGRRVRVILGSWWAIYRSRYARIQREQSTGVSSGLTAYERHIARLGVERSRAMFRAIGKTGIPADVLAQAGTVPENAPDCPAGNEPYVCDLDRKRALPRAKDNRIWLRELSTALAQPPRVIDPSTAYCSDTTCFGRIGSQNTFFDLAHLDPGLTRTLGRYFRPTINALMNRRPR